MHILLLGKNGLLGQALTKTLSNFTLTAWDIDELDITDFPTTDQKIHALKPNIIINATGYTNVDDAEKEPEKANLLNGTAVDHLAKICQTINATLIHFSTDYVFDGQQKTGYDEASPKNPLNAYGLSKALGEDLIQKNLQKYFIIRTSWLFGPGGPNFVNTMLNLAQKQTELKVVHDQIGKPTYSIDLAAGIKSIVNDYLADKLKPGIYHLTNENHCSWAELAQKIFAIKQLPVKVIPVTTAEFPRPAPRPAYSILNNHKLPLLRSWESALKEYLQKFSHS